MKTEQEIREAVGFLQLDRQLLLRNSMQEEAEIGFECIGMLEWVLGENALFDGLFVDKWRRKTSVANG